ITVTPTTTIHDAIPISVTNGTCPLPLVGTSTVTVNPLPTAPTVVNNGPICSGANAVFTITGTTGDVVTYSINGGANQTVTIAGGTATVTVTAATTNNVLTLVSVTNGTRPEKRPAR